MIRCKNIVSIINNIYDREIMVEDDCLNGNHKYKAKHIKIKLPERKEFMIELEEESLIYNSLSFVLSNINNKKFKSVKPNKYAFNILILILGIIEDYRIIDTRENKNIISNDEIVKKIIPFIDLDKKYIISIVNKIEYEFHVKGNQLCIMKVKKKI